MMTPDEAIRWARMVAGRRATEDDIRRIAGALLQAERSATRRTLQGVATVLEAMAAALRTAASLAGDGKAHGARVVVDNGWQRGPGEPEG